MSTTTTNITIKGTEHPHACAAIQHADNDGDPVALAITLAGRFFVVERHEADRIAALGVAFAYITDHHGKVMTVPIN